jgi:hypothetical protein
MKPKPHQKREGDYQKDSFDRRPGRNAQDPGRARRQRSRRYNARTHIVAPRPEQFPLFVTDFLHLLNTCFSSHIAKPESEPVVPVKYRVLAG